MKSANRRFKRLQSVQLVSAAVSTLLAAPASAADSTWNAGTGNWNTAANWSPVGVPNSTSTNVFIDNSALVNSIVTLNINATIGNLSIAAGDTLRMANGRALTFGGILSNAGTLEMASAGSFTDLRVNADATINGNGTILLSNIGNNRIYGASGNERLTIGAGQSIIGSGQFGAGQLKVTNQGLIAALGSDGLTFNVSSAAGTFNNAGGVIEVRDGSAAHFNGGTFEGGTLRGQVTSALTGSVSATLSGVNIEGALTLRNGQGLGIAGVSTNTGTLKLDSGGSFTDLRVNADATINGNGTILLSNIGNNRIYGSSATNRLTIGAGQTLRGSGQLGVNLLQITNNGSIVADQSVALTINPTLTDPLTNHGTVSVAAGSQMTLSGSNLLQDAVAAWTTVNGSLTTPLVDLRAGTLSGSGNLIGAVTNSGGIVAPGASPGKLTLQGNYAQGALGSLDIEIDGLVQGTQYDWLFVTGTASLDGALRLDFGYTPAPGSNFTILSSTGARTGTFSSLIKPSGWDVFVNYNPHDVTLTVVAVPEPETYAMLLAGLGLLGFMARRRNARKGAAG